MVQHGLSRLTSTEVELSHLTDALRPALQQSAALQASLRAAAQRPDDARRAEESVVAAQDLLVDMRDTLDRAASGTFRRLYVYFGRCGLCGPGEGE